MDTSELKSIIDNILSDAFKRIEYAYQHHCENSPKTSHNELTRLVFPSYANEKTRISEQELRFAFVEAFNAYCDENKINLFYSIETPTRKRYYFSGSDPKNVSQNERGRSAEFDLVIFDENLKRACLIEFKAKSAKPKDYKKDLLKLYKEIEKNDSIMCYFINVFGSSRRDTLPKMKNKIKLYAEVEGFNNEENIIIGYYVLEKADKGLIPLRELI